MPVQSDRKSEERVRHSGIGGAGNYHRLPSINSINTDGQSSESPSHVPPSMDTAPTAPTAPPVQRRAVAELVPPPRRVYRSGIGGAGNYHRRTGAGRNTPSSVTPKIVVVQPQITTRRICHSGIGGAGNYHRQSSPSIATNSSNSSSSLDSSNSPPATSSSASDGVRSSRLFGRLGNQHERVSLDDKPDDKPDDGSNGAIKNGVDREQDRGSGRDSGRGGVFGRLFKSRTHD